MTWSKPKRYAGIELDPSRYMVWTPFVQTMERAQVMAQRRDQYEAKKLPLFADQLPKNDPQDYLDGAVEWAEQFNFSLRKFLRKARLCRYLLAKHLSAADMAALAKRRQAMPASPEYDVDFWRSCLQDYLAGTLTIEYQWARFRSIGKQS